MKEALYTIPVNDAFNEEIECPVCFMHRTLEQDSIQYTLGPSYMEDDVRAEMDRVGFCNKHVRMLYQHQNRLGLALMLNSHLKKSLKEIEKLQKSDVKKGGSLFMKKPSSHIASYMERLNRSCFVCERIDPIFKRYLLTILYLYRTEDEFRGKFRKSKGFCSNHYAILHEMAMDELSGRLLEEFLSDLNGVYMENMKRVNADLEWFVDKFDYRNADAPWKNSKDAVPRAILKTNGTFVSE